MHPRSFLMNSSLSTHHSTASSGTSGRYFYPLFPSFIFNIVVLDYRHSQSIVFFEITFLNPSRRMPSAFPNSSSLSSQCKVFKQHCRWSIFHLILHHLVSVCFLLLLKLHPSSLFILKLSTCHANQKDSYFIPIPLFHCLQNTISGHRVPQHFKASRV